MSSTRKKSASVYGSALLALGLTILLLAAPAGAQGIRVVGSGGGDDLSPPPSPTCDRVVFLTEVSFDAQGNPIDIGRFGTSGGLLTVFDVPDFEPVGPSVIHLDEVITYDGHIGRATQAFQLQEQVYFEFLLDGVSQVVTPPTPDIPDGQRNNWLDLDMGSYTLPNGADTLRIHHVGGDPALINSLVVSALCGRVQELQTDATTTPEDPTTTVAPTTTDAPATTEAPATTDAPATTAAPSTTEASSTVEDGSATNETTTTVSTEVLGQTETVEPALAITGVEHVAAVIAAFAAIFAGVALLAIDRRRQVVTIEKS